MQPMTMRAAFSHQRQSAAISGHQRTWMSRSENSVATTAGPMMESESYVETEMSLSTCEMMSEAIRDIIRCNQTEWSRGLEHLRAHRLLRGAYALPVGEEAAVSHDGVGSVAPAAMQVTAPNRCAGRYAIGVAERR